jgi:hypothetical protein
MKKTFITSLLALLVALPALAGLGDPLTFRSSAYWTNNLPAAFISTNAVRLDLTSFKGTKYVAINVSFKCTTASTSNSIVLLNGWNVNGNYNANALTNITPLAAIICGTNTGTGFQSYDTTVTASGYPYFYIYGVTNKADGPSGVFTNYSITLTPQ